MKNIFSRNKLTPMMQWTEIILVLLLLYLSKAFITYLEVKDIEPTYVEPSIFIQQLENDEIFILCQGSGDLWQYQLSSEVPEEDRQNYFTKSKEVLALPQSGWYETTVYNSDKLDELLTEHGVIVSSLDFNPFSSDAVGKSIKNLLILWILGIIILEIFGLKTSFDKCTVLAKSKFTFNDVIGHEEIIEDMMGYVNIIRNTDIFIQKQIRQPKGILLTGPPGTGKTLIAKALAGEADVPFIYFDSSSAVDLYVGTGAKTVHNCFIKARKMAPCILFIDEIDAIGRNRDSNIAKSTEDDKALLALLQELDGMRDTAGILVVGATNCADKLDPALLRSGRFDRQIIIAPPQNQQTRKKLFEHYTKHYALADDVSLDNLALQTSGMTGADIAAVCNEAGIISVLRNSDCGVAAEDFELSIDKFLLKGNRVKSREAVQRDIRIVAIHEAGHAVASFLTGGTISRISIHETTSGVGGYVLEESHKEQLLSKKELQDKIIVLYAGRASEEIFFGEQGITSGAANDIQEATKHIKTMLMAYGLSEDLGMLDYNQLISAGLADESIITSSLQKLSHDLYKQSLELLQKNREKVEKLAEALLVAEELTGTEALRLLNDELKK